MILESFGQALTYFGDPIFWLYLFGGLISGLLLGALPGLSALTGLSLFLPFVFFLPHGYSLTLMTAMYAVVFTGGAVSSILINVPGENANAPTMLDGFPMTKKGQAGRALGASTTASSAGGLLSAFFTLAMVPLIIPMVTALKSADMVFLILMGIAFIAVLGTGAMLKGLASGALGIIISLIGFQMVTGASRFTFGSMYLYDGIKIIPIALGLFGIPQLYELAVTGSSFAGKGAEVPKWDQVVQGMGDVFRHWKLWLRSCVIGYVVGVTPGIGGGVATWVAYGQAKATSKHPELFGTGIVEGVIAPQSSDNASVTGAMLTTLVLGIPGSSAGAIILGAMLMMGVTPGPDMIAKNLSLTLLIIFSIIAANLIGGAICIGFATRLARISTIPARILVPILVMIILVAVYVINKEILDVLVCVVFGVVGILMGNFGYNRAALFLAYILGNLFEKYLFLALRIDGALFFLRPISMVLIVIIFVVVFNDQIRKLFSRKKGAVKSA